jgi:hypothetical protein
MMIPIRPDKALKRYSLVFMALTALVFSGCGAPPDPSGSTAGTRATGSSVPTEEASLIGCFACHRDDFNPAGLANVVGDSASALGNKEGWLSSKHANNETMMMPSHSRMDLSPVNDGFPPYSYLNSDYCSDCHDPQSDGTFFDDLYDSFSITSLGIKERPVIGCAACHGSGEDHFGLGDVQYVKPDAEKCGGCHDALGDEHLAHNPDGDRIYGDYASSKHSHSIYPFMGMFYYSPNIRPLCSKCHTDEGSKRFADVEGSENYLIGKLTNSLGATKAASVVQCRTCHDPHNPDNLVILANSTGSAEYNTCTQCHRLHEETYHSAEHGHSWGPSDFNNTYIIGKGNFVSHEIIYDTHVDLNSTSGVEGYILDITADDTCSSCHNVHSADIEHEVNEQWASSAHGGHVVDITERAILNASGIGGSLVGNVAAVFDVLNGTDAYGTLTMDPSDEFAVPGWIDHDFKTSSSCIRCHTSTGFKELANNPLKYDRNSVVYRDPADPGKFFAENDQKEVLYCWACHKDSSGTLRDPLDTTGVSFADYSEYDEPADRIANVPDIGGSNICIACHMGRHTGAEIAFSTKDFKDTSFVYPHYLPAGSILYRTGGYEYRDGDSYEYAVGNYLSHDHFKHDLIGVDEHYKGTMGEEGPCVGCHMRSSEGHKFEVVIKNASGGIESIPTYENTCKPCHLYSPYPKDEPALITEMEELEHQLGGVLSVMNSLLAIEGLHYAPEYPYIYNAPYDGGLAGTDCSTSNLPIANWQKGGKNSYIWKRYRGSWACLSDGAFMDGTADTGPDRMGAAFNYYLLSHEAGATAHNRIYTKRLAWDTLDYLDDGDAFNNSVSSTISNALVNSFFYDSRAGAVKRP